MSKIETFRDILNTRCPRCRQESMFKSRTLNLRSMLKMHKSCPKCGQDFMPEPGFYFGAMYFSYAINVALMATSGVAYEVLFSPDNILITLTSVFLPPLLLAPWNFRISRAIMLYALGGIKRKEK
jgi:uncharacterized protein (DUF983 family)